MSRVRTLSLALSMAVLACRRDPKVTPLSSGESDASVRDAATEPSREELTQRLSSRAVNEGSFARAVLYTWTTPDQIVEARAKGVLLLKDASSAPTMTGYDGDLAAIAAATATAKGGPIADLVSLLRTHPGLVKQRFSWATPFATRFGLAGQSYGDELVAITLKGEAWVGRFDAHDRDALVFFDLEGRPIPLPVVIASPHRIAAIYHVDASGQAGAAYREYVVCNESMIDHWEVATDEVVRAVADEVALLRALARAKVRAEVVDGSIEPASIEWSALGSPTTLERAWNGVIAFDTERYRPTKENLDALAASMSAWRANGDPLLVRPSVIFPPGKPAFVPPPRPLVRPPIW